MTTAKIERFLNIFTIISLFALASFVFTSLALSSLIHIFIFIPSLYFTYKAWKEGQLDISGSRIALLLLVLFGVISVIAAPDIANKFKGIGKLKYFLIGVLGIYAYRSCLEDKLRSDKVRLILNIFMVSVSIATISGIIGLYTGHNPLRFRAATDEWRATGMYGMAITYGYGIQFACILFCGLLLYRKKIEKFINTKLLIFATVISLAGLYLSYTRGAMVGFLVAVPFLLYGKSKKLFFSALIMGMIVVALVVGAIVSGKGGNSRIFQALDSESNMIRISQYRAAWHGFKENPLTGLGYRNFEPHSVALKEKYGLGYLSFRGHAHNNFLEILAGTGIFGFVAVVAFVLFWFIETFRRKDIIGMVVPAFVVAFVVSGLFQNTMMDSENMYLIMSVYALSQLRIS
ncbi:MAG: O-antigen ligase family protein, partial [Bacteriovoracaceae bacterium]|nr:O-antigen ligase family protein [Bacteriovoracaceae bacterium]